MDYEYDEDILDRSGRWLCVCAYHERELNQGFNFSRCPFEQQVMNEDPRLRRSSSQEETASDASPEAKASYMNSAQTKEEYDVRAARKR